MPNIEYNQSDRNKRIRGMRQRTEHMEREGLYWTEGEKEILTAMFYEGCGLTEIALELKRTEIAVTQQIHHLNLYEKVRRPSASKKQVGCLCERCTLQPSCKLKHCGDLNTEENAQQ